MSRARPILLCIAFSLACVFTLACEREPTNQAKLSQPQEKVQADAKEHGQAPEVITLRVAAASDLLFVFDVLAKDFATRTSPSPQPITLLVTFGSSGNFVAQIRNSAPFDLFLSADLAYPRALVAEGLVLDDSITQYATGHLALWWTQTSPPTTKALLDPAIKTIAIANPAHAPYGRAAVEALASLGIYETVKPKLVYGDNAAHAFQFAQSGAADIGMVPYSMVKGQAVHGKTTIGSALLLESPPTPVSAPTSPTGPTPPTTPPTPPTPLHAPIIQGACILKGTQHGPAAKAFLAYLTTPDAQTILREYGFTTPSPSKP